MNLETTCLGAAIAAGVAEGVNVWTIKHAMEGRDANSITFQPKMNIDGTCEVMGACTDLDHNSHTCGVIDLGSP